jgi:glycerol-3-phosphate dehydrogenase
VHGVDQPFDVAVVGAGVVGCAIARELARNGVRVVLLEAADDVGDGTSKANTAILHTGFDATPGTLEARLVREGYALLCDYATQVGIPVEPVGALLVAWDADELAALPGLLAKAVENGYLAATLVDAGEVYRLEPRLGPGALGGMTVPGESIICPWTTTLAYAIQALSLGVELRLRTRVTGIEPVVGQGDPGLHQLDVQRPGGPAAVAARFVVNAAGLSSDQVDRWMGCDGFTVVPRRGELVVFDKLARSLVRQILLPVPSARGKGVLVAPTVYGNVMLGPTAEDVDDPTATGSSEAGLEFLRWHGRRILPELLAEEVTAIYAGLRAATEHPDYQLRSHPGRRYVCVGGIRSTGLTASMAIARHVTGLLAEAGLALGPAREPAALTMPMLGEAFPRPYQRADLVVTDPEYGRVVCHCERVTAGEIRDALASPIPPSSVEGLGRRTRARLGRCQGFYCGAEVLALVGRVG